MKPGRTKLALDQAFVAIQGADHPTVLAELAAFVAVVSERNPTGYTHMRAEVLAERVKQE